MDEIVGSVGRVTQMMADIAAASREQLSGIEQVTGAVTQMDRVVQQNASLVAGSAAVAHDMAGKAEALMRSVAHFKLDGSAPQPRTEAPAVVAVPQAAPQQTRIRVVATQPQLPRLRKHGGPAR
jgi:hypothetical protein